MTLLEQHAATIAGVPAAHCASTAAATCCTTCSTPKQLDLARLLVGSEGTLALFTEATLRTIPLPGGRAWSCSASPGWMPLCVPPQLVAATGPAACELIDRRLLRLARGDTARSPT